MGTGTLARRRPWVSDFFQRETLRLVPELFWPICPAILYQEQEALKVYGQQSVQIEWVAIDHRADRTHSISGGAVGEQAVA